MDELDVPVAGGTLRVCRWPGAGPVVLAAHGITANALSWAEVAARLEGRVTLVAPDLRGRARSAQLPGPYGMAAHAADLVAVLDHLGETGPVPVVGHSMGGWVAAVTGVRYPDRVSSVLLVDGGVALAVPDGMDIDAVLAAVIGPATARLSMTFPTRGAYLDFFRAHPALGPALSPVVEAYVLRDLVGEEPDLRSSCSLEAIRADATDTLLPGGSAGAVQLLTQPVRMLLAQRGMLDEPRGLYDDERLAGAGLDRDRVEVEHVAAVNHYTIVAGPVGAAVVADRIAKLVAAP
jgi:pimeloyl-ACP methyl ester carboxylesterase